MFRRPSQSKDRVSKATRSYKRSFSDKQKLVEKLGDAPPSSFKRQDVPLTSPIATIVVGGDQRLFAAHEDVLCRSPFFRQVCSEQFFMHDAEGGKRINLTDEEPETFSAILEYLYKGDYYPRLLHSKARNAWYLEDADLRSMPLSPLSNPSSPPAKSPRPGAEPTMFHSALGAPILRDTAIYCAADRFGLDELKRLALRKQGLQSGIEVSTILRSARYAYDNTPDSDSRLRAHYLALIIRSRKTFKRSGTMQTEMEKGGKMFFDLFVAMCNHLDDLVEVQHGASPKTI